ncbi:MAG: ArsR/SmtB family transcription factor [Planctomycetota bacterium]|jgi:ArsR family transcriptional regulator
MSKNRNKKSQLFSQMFKALSNPHRLNIFMRLANCCGPGVACELHSDRMKECVGQLGRNLGIAPSTISHHMKELHRAGLIQMERRGKNIDCWVDPEVLKRLAAFFVELSTNGKPKRKK